jgi:hypothetical protein
VHADWSGRKNGSGSSGDACLPNCRQSGFPCVFLQGQWLSRFKLSQACRRIGQKNTKKGTVLSGGEVILLVVCAEQAYETVTTMNQSTFINWIVIDS